MRSWQRHPQMRDPVAWNHQLARSRQVVAFPQDGLLRDPGAAEDLVRAIRAGVNNYVVELNRCAVGKGGV